MSRRRRAVLLLGLALVLGGLAASDVARREAALEERLGAPVPVAVARRALEAGDQIGPGDLALRRVPERFAPRGAFPSTSELVGLRTTAAIPAGAFVSSGTVADAQGGGAGAGPALRPGERVADVVAVASPDAVVPGARVDVVVTREGEAGGAGRTALALEDVQVLAAAPAEAGGGASEGPAAGAPRVSASLRVTVRQAVYLAAAQSFAREVRLLPRAPDDRRRGARGLEIGADLG